MDPTKSFFIVTILAFFLGSSAGFETTMGIYRDNVAEPLPLDSEFTSIDSGSLHLWCNSTEPWKFCYWYWKKLVDDGDLCFVYDNDPLITNCGTVNKIEEKCEVYIDRSVTSEHQGSWNCELAKPSPSKNLTSSATSELVMMVQIGAVTPNVTSVEANPGDNISIECSTQDGGYPAAVFEWYFQGEAISSGEDSRKCNISATPQICDTTSIFKFIAPHENSQKTLICKALQTDSFGRQAVRLASISIKVIETPAISDPEVLSAGAIAGIAIGILILLLILLILLLAFFFGWCCFSGRKKKKPNTLVVRDVPTQPEWKPASTIDEHPYNEKNRNWEKENYFLKTQIPSRTNSVFQNENYVNAQSTLPASRKFQQWPSPPKKASMVKGLEPMRHWRDRLDPYDSELDIPVNYGFRVDDIQPSSLGTSLSSLASNHLDSIDFDFHLCGLDLDSSSSSGETCDTSAESELARTFSNQYHATEKKFIDDESWV